MKKIKQLSLVSLISFIFVIFNYVTTVSAQCDSSPACNPTSGTCCNQCDPNPACVASDPNAIPCCGGQGGAHLSGNDNMNRGPDLPHDQYDERMNRGHDLPHDQYDKHGPNDHMRDPGCDPKRGCQDDSFQEKHHNDGPNDQHGHKDDMRG